MTAFRQWSLVSRRELGALLTLPLFYVLCGIFFLLTSLNYVSFLVEFNAGGKDVTVNVTDSVVRPTFYMVFYFLMVQVPLLTMRVFAEEQSNGMLDLLQTTPLRNWPLLLGKFTGTVAALGLYLLVTLLFPAITATLGDVEWPVVIGSVAALVLSISAFTAIGIFFSSVTESQVVAAVMSYVTLFLLLIAQVLSGTSGVAAVDDAAQHFALTEHLEGLLSGNIAPMNVSYFVMLTVCFLFLTARVLESRRWRS